MDNREDYLMRQVEYYQSKVKDLNQKKAELDISIGRYYRLIAHCQNELLQIRRNKDD